MEARKFVVHNQTRNSTLSSSVTSVNAALEPLKVLKVLIEGLPANSRTGLWLTNFKGVPVARTLSPFDLVYLDKENQVLHAVQLSRDGEFAPFKGRPASALVLPPNSLTQSHTSEGDRLELQPSEAEVQQPAVEAKAPPAESVTQEASAAAPPVPPAPAFPASENFFSSLASPLPPVETKPEEQSTAPETLASVQPTGVEESVSGVPVELPSVSAAESGLPQTPLEPAPSTHDFFTPGARIVIPPVEAIPEVAEPAAASQEQRRTPASQPEVPAAPALVSISQPSPVRGPARPGSAIGTPPGPDAAIAAAPEAPTTPARYGRPVQKQQYSWKVRLLRWLFPHLVIEEPDEPEDRRRADRQSLSGLVAYYFTGGSPAPQRITNISVTGFYLQTDERWMPGTVVRMTLQRLGSKGDDPADTITVNSRIVRWGPDGEGFEFILTDLEE